MSNIDKYLVEFAAHADDWFKRQDWLERRYLYITDFFRDEHLRTIEWEDIQALASNLHAFNMAIAKNRAAGRPNHAIEHYRKSFEYLIRGKDPLEQRIDALRRDRDLKISGWGLSAVTELVAYLFGDTYTIYNDRNKVGLRVLEINPGFSRTDSPGTKFQKYNTAIRPLVEAYTRIVGNRTQLPIHLEVDQFMSFLYEKYRTVQQGDDVTDVIETSSVDDGVNYWAIAAGERAAFWEEWQRDNVIRIGWGYLGDLTQYDSKEEIQERLRQHAEDESSHKNSALACWEFAHVMNPGDIVIVKKGRGILLGYGVVTSDYYFDEEAEDFCHVRGVEWKLIREFVPADNRFLSTKTLSRITRYKSLLERVIEEFGKGDVKAWIFQGNPSKYDLTGAVNSLPFIWWRINQHKNQSFKDDRVYLWESGPNAGIVAVCTALNEPEPFPADTNDSRFEKNIEPVGPDTLGVKLQIDKVLENRITRLQLLSSGGQLAGLQILRQPQGTNYPLTPEQESALADLLNPPPPDEPYTMKDALADIFLTEEALRKAVWLLDHSKNMILTGPPGVGKSYFAKRLIWLHQGLRDSSRIETIQFHPAFSYEDFIQGFRPTSDGNFQLRSGAFFDFCLRAQEDPIHSYYFIIDEINRAHLSKVFGETMMLIEPDKRGQEYAVRTAYGEQDSARFFVPENVYLIGTMNTADRSLAMVDYALRRRFAFLEIEPAFESAAFAKHLANRGWDSTTIQRIVKRFADLNKQIAADDRRLGAGYQIGHSYFCKPLPNDLSSREFYTMVVEHEIGPLLREYWFDQGATAQKYVEELLAAQ